MIEQESLTQVHDALREVLEARTMAPMHQYFARPGFTEHFEEVKQQFDLAWGMVAPDNSGLTRANAEAYDEIATAYNRVASSTKSKEEVANLVQECASQLAFIGHQIAEHWHDADQLLSERDHACLFCLCSLLASLRGVDAEVIEAGGAWAM